MTQREIDLRWALLNAVRAAKANNRFNISVSDTQFREWESLLEPLAEELQEAKKYANRIIEEGECVVKSGDGKATNLAMCLLFLCREHMKTDSHFELK